MLLENNIFMQIAKKLFWKSSVGVINPKLVAEHLAKGRFKEAHDAIMLQSNNDTQKLFLEFLEKYIEAKSQTDEAQQFKNLLEFVLNFVKQFYIMTYGQWLRYLRQHPISEDLKLKWPTVYDFLIQLNNYRCQNKVEWEKNRNLENEAQGIDSFVGKKVALILQRLAIGVFDIEREVSDVKNEANPKRLQSIVIAYRQSNQIQTKLQKLVSIINSKQNNKMQTINSNSNQDIVQIQLFISQQHSQLVQQTLKHTETKQSESMQQCCKRFLFEELNARIHAEYRVSNEISVLSLSHYDSIIVNVHNQEYDSRGEQIKKQIKETNELKERLSKAEKQVSSFCDGLRLQQVKYSEICSKVQKFEEELTNKNQEISYLSKQLTEKEGEINRITEILMNSQREAKLNQHNFQKTKTELKAVQLQMEIRFKSQQQILTDKIKFLTDTIQSMIQKESTLKKYFQQAQKKADHGRNEIQFLRNKIDNDHRSLFNYEIFFEQYSDEKKYLISQLTARIKKRIKGTKLLYHMDSSNLKASFHSYIDNHPFIVVIVTFQNGRLIAAYSQGPLTQTKESVSTDALLISPTKRQTFYLKQKSRAFVYDTYYLIIGQSDLRLKPSERQIFSNFGLQSGSFDARTHTVTTIMGQLHNSRVTNSMQAMQVYKLHFEDNYF